MPVLHNISFTAHPNETVAIMGETGCGKTSLINLIPRFYEPTEGQIRIDGIPVEQLKLYDLRKQIGLATQDVLLYSDTIEGNIAYGDDSIKMNEVVKFARYSAAADFISKMPEATIPWSESAVLVFPEARSREFLWQEHWLSVHRF